MGEWKGEEVLGIKLNFSKRYITLAPIASLIGLAFQLQDPDGLIGDKEDYGITCALIPRSTKGLEIGRRHLPIGDAFLNGPIKGDGIFVPLDSIIGGKEMAAWLYFTDSLEANFIFAGADWCHGCANHLNSLQISDEFFH